MSTLEAIVLGLVQGLTEFLPISSSGHLRIVPAFLGWEDPGAGFTAVIQLGTMAAVLIYFRADLWRIAGAWLSELRVPIRRASQEARLGWFIVLGTIPIAIFGFVFKDQIESGARSLYLIGSALILFSFVMLAAERVGAHRRDLTEMNGGDGLFVGIAQALALVPGVSRSGATISAGLFRDFDRVAGGEPEQLLVGGLGGGDGGRDAGRLRHRLCGDRLADPLPRHPHAGDLRRLPDRARGAGPGPDRLWRHQLVT